MKFMGKWIIWSHAANGYVVPGQPMGPPTMLYANSSAHMDEAVYNLYAGLNEGELIIQANSLAASSGSWVQCDSAANPVESVIPTANPASASPITTQQNGNWTNLLYGSTLLYVNPFFSIWLYEMMLGNPDNDGDPNLTITIKTQSLDTYKKSRTATGVDFSNIDFTGVDLFGIDFTNANFTGAKMNRQTELPPASVLRVATFTKAHLDGVEFGGCDLTGADFTGASLAGALFDSMTMLAGAKFVNVDLSGLDFAGVDLSGADFTGAIVNGLNLQGATLTGAIMPGLDLTKLDSRSYTDPPKMSGNSNQLTLLTGSKIPFSLLNNNWQWTDLRNATIPDLPPSITQLKASGAKLSGLNQNVLTGISLEQAVLDNTLMDGLGLSGAHLTGASLIEASLHGAALTDAKLAGATMTGAQLGTLSRLFTLPSSAETALNAGQVAPLVPFFTQNGITLSSTATLNTLATDRVWQLNDAGNHITYTIRLETQTDSTQVLTVYATATSASLVGAYMPGAVLTGVNLYAVLASSSQFYGSGARIDGSAILEEAQLNSSNLSNLNLTQAQLLGTNLSSSYLFNAKFNKARLTPSANGVATNLSNANLQGADFTDAQLYGANLANAAVAISTPTTANPNQGGVYLFSLPYSGDKVSLQQYTAELNAASTKFSLNPQGDAPTLQKYVSALENNDPGTLKIPFLLQHPPIVLSPNAQIQTIAGGSVWQIVDGQTSYTLWTDIDQNGNTELYAAPSLTNMQAAFQQNDITLRWQASASVDTAGQQWLIDNDSQNPQNFSTGYVRFILKLDGGVLDVYGTALRVVRLGDGDQEEYDTETCNITTLDQTNMSGDTVCPNGATLSVNQSKSSETWDVKWLRAATPPAPPTCVPTDYSWCPQTQTQADKQ